ncbi:hypothetical protein TCAL_14314 [Tigriopus californicus]|uniref:PWWP domain-containing protein n=1 Tax=Tigriopus californicus TaxID=6832 RepID=A0A553NBV2_TIGCA|nr:hypothetical protein TCAL_14314 [Tigriopus californicus]
MSLIQDPSDTIDQFVDLQNSSAEEEAEPVERARVGAPPSSSLPLVSPAVSVWSSPDLMSEGKCPILPDRMESIPAAAMCEEESLDSITDNALNEELAAMQKRDALGPDPLVLKSPTGPDALEDINSFDGVKFKNEANPNDERFQEGYLVWAKVKGYSYWPAVVTVDPVDAVTVKFKFSPAFRRVSRSHVHFLAYANQRAWIHESSMLHFKGIKAYQIMAKRLGSKRAKDFFPTKKYQEMFDKAVALAEEVLPLPFPERIKRLGYVYVKVQNENATADQSRPPQVKSEVNGKVKKAPRGKRKRSADGKDTKSAEPIAKKKRLGKPTPSLPPTRKSLDPTKPVPVQKAPVKQRRKAPGRKKTTQAPSVPASASSSMAGFPYWPCFVTQSPEGQIRKESSKRGLEYYAQFFNWNNESGWIRKAMPWKSLEEFQTLARKIPRSNAKEWKAWNPSGKMMQKKWEIAVSKAQSTAEMTRKERYDSYVVFYKSDAAKERLRPKVESGATNGQESKKPRVRKRPNKKSLSRPVFTPITTEDITPSKLKQVTYTPAPSLGRPPKSYKFFKSKNSFDKRNGANANSPVTRKESVRQKPGPKRSKMFHPEESSSMPNSDHGDGERGRDSQNTQIKGPHHEMPPKWKVVFLRSGQPQYESPEGIVFNSLQSVMRHLFLQNTGPFGRKRSYSFSSTSSIHSLADSASGWFLAQTDEFRYKQSPHSTNVAGNLESFIRYETDDSLPKGWTVKKIREITNPNVTSSLFISPEPEEECFNTKMDVANYLEPKGHPALEVGQIMSILVGTIPRSQENQTVASSPRGTRSDVITINLKQSSHDELPNHAALGKSFLKSFVDLVQLPNIFLTHPSVRVTENSKEMVISDIFTGEFIAKKVTCEEIE